MQLEGFELGDEVAVRRHIVKLRLAPVDSSLSRHAYLPGSLGPVASSTHWGGYLPGFHHTVRHVKQIEQAFGFLVSEALAVELEVIEEPSVLGDGVGLITLRSDRIVHVQDGAGPDRPNKEGWIRMLSFRMSLEASGSMKRSKLDAGIC